ncbi:cytochrome P450 [Didymella exigua CBS 183.55]|uniref:Cytochrome P450 n=1 Tax=Didymella exigua CBS 183.55 TaxID=1150837 RepID=A0A6A5R9P2_9PLEO|nr:cytochrome P450 [Didymella exigua CBS 183.55]KAF1924462.1 cytochrome P450 [Didymella exigua CBS 183.55]
MPFAFLVLFFFIAIVLYGFNKLSLRREKRKPPLPSGPKGLPPVGNLKLKDVYEPIIPLTVLGQTIVIIHDRNMASEFMEKRAVNQSRIPVIPFGNYCGWEDVMGAQLNNPSFRGQRRHVFQQVGTKNLVANYWPLQEGVAAELILRAIYRYTTEAYGADPLVDLVNEVMEQFSQAFVPGRWAIDLIPALMYLPEWFTGPGWKQSAKTWIKLAAVSLYTVGADITVSAMSSFFLAMAMQPSVQAKSHVELDGLFGANPTRLPTSKDRAELPYKPLIVEEAQRWHPVAAMGLSHRTDEEDTIAGYRISKDAVRIPAMWWYTHDPSVYHNAETFMPEGFDEPYNEPYASNVMFRLGRRRHPGYLFTDASLFLIMAQSLALFDIIACVDDAGKEVKLEHGFSAGAIGKPTPFEVRLLPRSAAHEKRCAKSYIKIVCLTWASGSAVVNHHADCSAL